MLKEKVPSLKNVRTFAASMPDNNQSGQNEWLEKVCYFISTSKTRVYCYVYSEFDGDGKVANSVGASRVSVRRKTKSFLKLLAEKGWKESLKGFWLKQAPVTVFYTKWDDTK